MKKAAFGAPITFDEALKYDAYSFKNAAPTLREKMLLVLDDEDASIDGASASGK